MINNVDVDLARIVFDIYVNSNSLTEYSQGLRNLSNLRNITVNRLRDLRYMYYEFYASFEERRLHDEVACRNHIPKYVEIVERILSLDGDKRLDYMYSLGKNISYFEIMFERYIKNHESYRKILMSLLNDYIVYVDELKLKKSNKNGKLSEAKFFYDDLIRRGFFDKNMYIKTFFGEDYIRVKRLFGSYDSLLRDNNLLDGYKEKMESNRIKYYNENLVCISELMERLCACRDIHNLGVKELDIIDFYLIMKMDVGTFKKLCKGFLDDSRMALLSVFDSKYKYTGDSKHIVENSYSFGDVSISDSEKNRVLNFLDDHNIPRCYLVVALRKYIAHELDDYIGKINVKKSN
ncbi:MAG: hypothetical protein J6D28_00845 [Bacilli bacterium]|nr:hypothetical protein [Bacilli bacterium]